MLKKIKKILKKSFSKKKEKKSSKTKAKKIKVFPKKKKNITPRGKIAKKDKTIEYFKIFNVKHQTCILYRKRGDFFIKNLSKKIFSRKVERINIVNNFGFDISTKELSEISIAEIGGELILNYKREYNKKIVTAFAQSNDGVNFKEIATTSAVNSKLIFAKKNFFQDGYVAYTGKNFIYFAKAKSLNRWNIPKEYLLTPRQSFFDHNGLNMIETVDIEKGVFLLYESSFVYEGYFYLQIGGALFEKDNPEKLLWRSENPIWTQKFKAPEIESVLSLGATNKKNKITVYYAINNELAAVDLTVPRFYKKEEKKIIAVKRHQKNPIITPREDNKWENKAVFNAAAIHAEGKFHLIYRALGEDDVSTFGYASSENGVDFKTRFDFPVYVPREKFEGVHGNKYIPPKNKIVYESGGGCCGGCEDPRLTKIGDTIYMIYVAFNGYEVPGVAISSIKYEDFINHRWNWSKARLISKPGQMQKNWMLFPEKINGKYAVIHSITPKIMIDYFDNMDKKMVYIENSFRKTDTGENRWDNIVRGAGAPPIKTDYGWLLFYHAMDKRDPNRYKIGAMILDINNPEKILYRSQAPILEPDEDYENEGYKAGVIYVCGAVIEKGVLHIYYGGADTVMCVATAKVKDFMKNLIEGRQVVMKKIAI